MFNATLDSHLLTLKKRKNRFQKFFFLQPKPKVFFTEVLKTITRVKGINIHSDVFTAVKAGR